MVNESAVAVKFKSGVASSKSNSLHLIPAASLRALGRRFEYGIHRKGDLAWNILRENPACLDDKAFAIERLGHVMEHCAEAIERLVSGAADPDAEWGGDAGAIMFGGALLAAYHDHQAKKVVPVDIPAPPDVAPVKRTRKR